MTKNPKKVKMHLKKYRRYKEMIQKEIRIALEIHLTVLAVFAALVLTMA